MNEAAALQLSRSNAKETMLRLQNDPLFHVVNVQGCSTIEPYQQRIIEAVHKYDRVAIRSCHDTGKTFTMAKIILWYGSCFEQSKIITTAPTFNQVKRLLWSEIRAGWRRSNVFLGGDMLTTEWKIDDDWFALGFTSRGEGEGDGQGITSSFQGFHAKNILVVFDEATGIPRNIWNQVEGMLTSANVKFIAIGNPTSRQTDFFKCFTDPMWHKIALSCFDSPNLIANDFTDLDALRNEIEHVKSLNDEAAAQRLKSYKVVMPQLLSTSWVIAMGIKWGINHPLFISKVLGDFPEEDDNVLISLAAVEEAQYRHESTKTRPQVIGRYVGIDPARYGPDKTMITVLEDHYQTTAKVLLKSSISNTVNEVLALLRPLPRVKRGVITIDGTGLGAGVVDGLIQARNDPANEFLKYYEIREIHFGAQCTDDQDKEHFANIKAKMFHLLSDAIRTTLAIKPENVYLEELPMIVYHYTPKGQLAIESKDDYKVRTGLGSPDHSDSLALANFGRMDTNRVGEFTDKHKPKVGREGGTFAPSLNSGNNW